MSLTRRMIFACEGDWRALSAVWGGKGTPAHKSFEQKACLARLGQRWVALLVKQGHPECQSRHSKATAPFHLKSSLLQVKLAQHQAGRLPWVTVLGEGATGRKPPWVSLGGTLGFRWQCDPDGHCRHAAWPVSVEGPCSSHAP